MLFRYFHCKGTNRGQLIHCLYDINSISVVNIKRIFLFYNNCLQQKKEAYRFNGTPLYTCRYKYASTN